MSLGKQINKLWHLYHYANNVDANKFKLRNGMKLQGTINYVIFYRTTGMHNPQIIPLSNIVKQTTT